ncbi:poly(A)-specific ribonuclease PARN isoform X2 [Rhododendron vialii]|uniref:poly(A)-specific ribonuclease PARN isoform X2 n=1 Tax=Rhododendron vialii TaxID=182163 RepID=UPI00265DC40A|nr:poly(A)-specific ribonuclease PARN isoform X2 [Rhododendron vialii]
MKKQWMLVGALSKTLTLASFTRSLCSSSTATTPTFALKNVTKSNFESALGDLRRLVRDADFVAVDLEMTGVTSAPWRESFEFDRFDIRYLKVKDSAEKFAVVQFGVCPFRWDHSKQSFVAHPHNFYIFPRKEIPVGGRSYEFLCQTTSIDFLARYQFDFNLCIQEGISYLSRGQEDDALRNLHSMYEDELRCNSREARDTPVVRIADVLFTERMKNRICEWRDGLLLNRNHRSETQEVSNDSPQQFQTIFFKMRPALLLNGFTSHQLRLIQLKEVKDGLHKEAEMKIKAAVGFRHVIDLLSSEQKLIVGHNCFLDIAHIYSKFLGPLPSTAEEYVSSVNKYFPYIIDTKILLNAKDMHLPLMKKSSTSLSRAFSLLCPEIASSVQGPGLGLKPRVKVEVQVDDMRSLNWNSGAKHEAGYDAFMTGCVFAQACSHLGYDFKLYSPSTNLANDEKLQKHINLLYLSWINGDIIDLRTGKRTAESAYSNNLKIRYPRIVFQNIALIWGFLPKIKAREIRECITKVFGLNSVSSVYHLDETAVFVQFSKAELVTDFLQLKETLERNNDPISVLHPLSKLLEGRNTHAATYESYKRICGSPISEVLFADQAEAMRIKWKTESLESNREVETQENEMATFPNTSDRSESGKINRIIDNLACGHIQEDEAIDSSYTCEAQLSK